MEVVGMGGSLGRSLAGVAFLGPNESRLPMYEPGKPLDAYGENPRRLIGAHEPAGVVA